MPKTLMTRVFVLVLLTLCCGVISAPWLSDSFDSYANGSLTGQGGWAGNYGVVRVQTGFAKSGKAAEGNCLLWGGGQVSHTASASSGYHYIDFDAAMDTAYDGYGSNLGFIKFYSSTGAEITRLYYGHQQFKVLLAPANPFPILENTGNRVWHHIRIGINLANSTMDVWVDGVQKVIAGPTYSIASSIAKVEIGQWLRTDFTKAETYVDNLVCQPADAPPPSALAGWTSPNRYRVLLTAHPLGATRDNSPASVDIDLPAALASMGGTGTFDEHAIEVIGYDASGAPRVYDSSRAGYEKYLLPWRLDRYYQLTKATLNFVMPDHTCTTYAVYFDAVESGLGRPTRYHGLVGDGDLFNEGYKRREINACHFDSFCDFDGDGDLDLFKGGVESFVYCYENVGGNRFVDAGRLSSGGSLFYLPGGESRGGRSWVTVEFYDWDRDGDMDFFPSFHDGPYKVNVVYYENTTPPGGPLTFTDRGIVMTQSGQSLYQGGWFPAPTFVVDWDGDGDNHIDVLMGTNNRCYLHRNLRLDGSGKLIVDNAVAIKAAGTDIDLSNPRFDAADIDGDGDKDLFSGTQPGTVYFFRNIDTTVPRTNPTFAAGQVIAFAEPYSIGDGHSAVKVADFTGDGLPDFVVGRYWERSLLAYPEAPREYGWLYQNDGSNDPTRFIKKDAATGAPYTERFQICDAVRQNCVRAVDWNNDGKTDLVSGDTDGFIWLFANQTDNLFPVFATGEKLRANGAPIAMSANGGHARHDICDWNNDGRKDLIVADGGGWVTLFLNVGTDPAPVLAAGQRVYAGGSPIARGGRSSALVCDWNNDGKKDLVFADQDNPGFYWFRNTNTDANPVLAAAEAIDFGGGQVSYVRPNLGDYVDFDGDGKKDFIGCEFETDIRFYQNTGSGGAGALPQFADTEGVLIVEPWNIMMVSGADAFDWRSDGDLDILTGQGHGGGGLRFYERDYIDDFLRQSYPRVFAASQEQAFSTTQVKSLPNGASVTVVRGIVTACFDDFFYVASADRVSGIRVELPGHAIVEGAVVDIWGVLGTSPAGERYIAATSVLAGAP